MPTEGLPCRIDAVRLAQILGNLPDTASKYTPTGAHLAGRGGPIRHVTRMLGWRIQVWNAGPGAGAEFTVSLPRPTSGR